MVIFGASGDLSGRKLIPGLFSKFKQGLLPEKLAVLGAGRTEYDDDSFRGKFEEDLKSLGSREETVEFLSNVHYINIKANDESEFGKLKEKLADLCGRSGIDENFIFYLATPPGIYMEIAGSLGAVGLNRQNNGWKRIIVEKPFGSDLESARRLNRNLQRYFRENQIYRIDHYLGKETVQNVLALRFSNGIFEPLWNSRYVNHVELTSAENIGIEGRGSYYDNAGALRDMVQNHMLQLTGLIAMEPPARFDPDTVRDETLKVFQSLRPMSPEDISRNVIRGQYTESTVRGDKVKGYRNEKDVAPDSRTETYVAMKFYIDNWRWGGVPFYIRSGKRLPTRVTEVVINFKKTPHYMFARGAGSEVNCNQLVIRIQPDEGILLRFGIKSPGSGFRIENVAMDFHYSDLDNAVIEDAYERLLLDSMHGDATLYARADAVEACWAFVNPILAEWEDNPRLIVYGYPAGTWGPKEAGGIFHEPGLDWRYPCKNLANDGIYCEL
jgi:glucose-6-phosphate 1-dehydrogenase